jgi:hypothetical protein
MGPDNAAHQVWSAANRLLLRSRTSDKMEDLSFAGPTRSARTAESSAQRLSAQRRPLGSKSVIEGDFRYGPALKAGIPTEVEGPHTIRGCDLRL